MDVTQLNVQQAREALQLIDTILTAPEDLPPALVQELGRHAQLLRERWGN